MPYQKIQVNLLVLKGKVAHGCFLINCCFVFTDTGQSESEIRSLFVTGPNDNHSPEPVMREVSP